MKLEVGKIYLTRGGEKAKVKTIIDGNVPYEISAELSNGRYISYTLDGKYWNYDIADSLDIVSEFDESDVLFDEPAEEEPQKVQEQQPLFEVGKTYKDGENRDITIVSNDETYQAYPIVGRDTETHAVYTYTKSGLAWSGDRRSLIPPEPPLPIVIGGFYLDNNDILRVLIKENTNKQHLFASAVNGEDGYGSIYTPQFPGLALWNIYLVKLLTYEEAQEIINKKK